MGADPYPATLCVPCSGITRKLRLEWDRLVRDLDHLKEMEIVTAGKEVIIRNELRGDTAKVFRAAGVVIPPAVRIVPQEDAPS